MKKVLIISPHFPPVNAPDMHRIRQGLPYFEEFDWKPVVFTVEPEWVERAQDPLLVEYLPSDVEIHRVRAFSARWTRKFGLGNLGIRSYLQLRRAVNDYLRNNPVDLIYFSTTIFVSMALGPHWKRKFGVPFVVDLQDPWRNDYFLNCPCKERPRKFWFDYRLNHFLEMRTLPKAVGIISVSAAYQEVLQKRYPSMQGTPFLTLPFGGFSPDFQIAAKLNGGRKDNTSIDVVYIGRGGKDMDYSTSAFFKAFHYGLNAHPDLFTKVQFKFIGTSYAPAGKGEKTFMPLAEKAGIAKYVTETTDRFPYFQSLKRLQEADLLFMPGSTDATYTASKLYPYILARKPILAVFNEKSSVVDILKQTNAGEAVTFNNEEGIETLSERIFPIFLNMLKKIPYQPGTDWKAFEPYTAREMTRKQCYFFEDVMAGGKWPRKLRREI